MELKTAIEILEYHQEWRLGKREDMIHEPKKLTQALDILLSEVKKFRLDVVSGSVFLQVGMKVKIKSNTKNYSFDAGKEKTITKDLQNFGKSRAFGLDGDDGIWCIEDFEYCVNYPHLAMR